MLNTASTWASNLALQQGPRRRRLPFKGDFAGNLRGATHALGGATPPKARYTRPRRLSEGGVCTASGVGGTPACGAGWYILRDVNGLPQPSHPRRAQNQGAYPTPSTVTRFAGTDLYAAAAPRRRGPRGVIWSTPEPPPMGAPTVRLTPRGHGRPRRPPERAAVRRKLGLRGLPSRPARTCLVLKPAKRLAIRPNPSACFCHV